MSDLLIPPDDPEVLAALGKLTPEEQSRAAQEVSRHFEGQNDEYRAAAGRNVWVNVCVAIGKARREPAKTAGVDSFDFGTGAVQVTAMSSVEARSVAWLWPARIPLRMITLLDGDPGVGKSTMLLDLAARVTRGAPMPDEPETVQREPGTVLLLSAEDDPSTGIRPRLDAAGADAERAITLQMTTDDGTRDPVVNDADLVEMELTMMSHRPVLIIVDPLVAYLTDGTDTNSDHSVRRALKKLARFAQDTDCAIVAVRHVRKGGADNAIHRGGGSIGFIGAARAALAVAYDPDDETKQTRILAVTKNNYAPIAPSWAFKLEQRPHDDVAHVEWLGVSKHSANALTADPKPGKERAAIDEATDYLLHDMRVGEEPVWSREIEDGAKALGISKWALREAQKRLGIKPYREYLENVDGGVGKKGRWMWSLPKRGDAYEGDDA